MTVEMVVDLIALAFCMLIGAAVGAGITLFVCFLKVYVTKKGRT